ncbi:MAG: hypothetical protein AAF694_18580 [Bacteroidota bacterium]
MAYQKVLGIILLWTLLFLGIMIGVNVGVDLDNSLRRNREKKIAKWLFSKKNVANLKEVNERLIHKILISQGKQVDCIVLGSSRGLQINQSLFENQPFYNYSMKGASIQDFFSLTYLLQENCALPEKVIFVADPWLFNTNNQLTDWAILSDSYQQFAQQLAVEPFYAPSWEQPPVDYRKIWSFTYLSRNLGSLMKNEFPWVYPTYETDLSAPIKHCDGSLIYPAEVRESSIKEIFARAERMAYGPSILSLGDYDDLDKPLQKHFLALIRYYEEQNIEVLLYLPPFNPIVWGTIQNNPNYRSVLKAERYYKRFAAKNGLLLMGSYNPHNMYLNPEDFYDGMHLSRESTQKFFLHGVSSRSSGSLLSMID